MCFSAEASFSASIVLAVIGVATIKKTTKPAQRLFAAIPVIFSFQQLTEGILWLALPGITYAAEQQIATYVFLILAQVVWPVWVPLSILVLEENKKRKRVLSIVLGIGCIVSVYLAYCLAFYNVKAEIVGHHIYYDLNFAPQFKLIGGACYILSTVFSPLISSVKRMQSLGFIILGSYIISKIFFDEYVISVWCFFAAIISVMVMLIIGHLTTNEESLKDDSLSLSLVNRE